ncbi:phenylalanine--tRNA ligase subunit beta [Silvanigrella paludirubra]|uniref:Phenylalanine--tRNA ligase beta subunit n=1 Tax=Silvanigrella paludirubra TaxID=2499159 RepID=A0A6N6VPH5_9BACT|nr:phenylalanine--tRNA ligase subunit beta [Silvanigrella paludirubra]KAB8036846.1 phenylalanine--tRNA ligase subunit beta [Silvanigrella paludirubra]
MLASLKFVEKFISLPKVTKNININGIPTAISSYDIEKINPLLTRQGFEVDSVIKKGEGLETVVVGRIEKTEPHPNASKLQICQVNVGNNIINQIICGAKNARQGLYVAVALPSTKLPNNLEIKSSKIRDIESNGMLCSREELGLPIKADTDGDGIWEIEEDSQGGVSSSVLIHQLGKPIFEVLGISDTILELSVTPNRPDMLCHEGVSKELKAAFTYANIPFKLNEDNSYSNKISITEEKIKNDAINHSSVNCAGISFSAENHLGTPAFFMLIDSTQVKPSPAWLRILLENLGQNSINNIVDASNYILLAHGQPSHAFDLEKLSSQDPKSKKLILRKAKQGEKFTGLDGKERELNDTDEIISDIEGTQGLLGVLGGEHSKVTETTKKIVVEFANPNPVSVRRSSRRHARQTDASFMFEKGIDASARYQAAAEYLGLISSEQSIKPIYCGTVHSQNLNKKPEIKTEFPKIEIEFNSLAQEKILGAHIIDFDKQLNILKSLGFELSSIASQAFKVTVPSWRSHDIVGEADLVEEFIRVVGIDNVPSTPMISPTNVSYDDPHYKYLEKISARCTSLGYNEVISLHFMRTDDYEKLGLKSILSLGEPVALLNPIIGDEPLLHNTLIPDLLRKVTRNLGYGTKSGQLFHSCRTFQNYDVSGKRVFVQNGESIGLQKEFNQKIEDNLEYHYSQGYAYSREKTQEGRPVETPRLAGVVFGNKTEKTWQNSSETNWSLHDIIAHVTDLVTSLGSEISVVKISDTIDNSTECKFHPFAKALHPGRRVGFYILDENNQSISLGWAGELHPKTMRNYDIDVSCFVFEINIAVLIRSLSKPKNVKRRVAITQRFPTISRDFAFLIDDSVTAKELNEVVIKSLEPLIINETPALIQAVNIFDIYKGKNIAENKKSVAFHISLEPTERTFNDKDIQKITNTVIKAVTSELRGELRG